MLFSLLNKLLNRIDSWIVVLQNNSLRKRFRRNNGIINHPHILKGEKYIIIGNGTTIDNAAILTAWDSYGGESFQPSITIGNNCHVGEHVHISAINKIIIGNNVLTGRHVYISDNSHGHVIMGEVEIPPIDRPLYSKGEVVIEDNVWIGEHVCILPGVHIGKAAIVGANAVVTHDVPANCVVGGNPAKIIKQII